MRIDIPTNPDRITIRQYRDYLLAMTGHEKVAVATGLPLAKVKHLKFDAIATICDMFEQVLEMAQPQLPAQFNINIPSERMFGRKRSMELGFIPNIEAMTAGEFADLMQLSGDKDSVVKYMVEMACVYFRPITDRIGNSYRIAPYDSDTTHEYREFVERIPFRFYLGARAFFLTSRNELLLSIPEFSEMRRNEVEKELKKVKMKRELRQRATALTERWLGMVGFTTSKHTRSTLGGK